MHEGEERENQNHSCLTCVDLLVLLAGRGELNSSIDLSGVRVPCESESNGPSLVDERGGSSRTPGDDLI